MTLAHNFSLHNFIFCFQSLAFCFGLILRFSALLENLLVHICVFWSVGIDIDRLPEECQLLLNS